MNHPILQSEREATTMNHFNCPAGVEIHAPFSEEFSEILAYEALGFMAGLVRQFDERRARLLEKRSGRQAEINMGKLPKFREDTANIRNKSWQVSPQPADLQDRRVEITGPAGDRKMVINALNSGASCFMADFEDANSPTWENSIQGQINLRDAIHKTIGFTNENGKQYRLNDKVATLLVRPRGWHLTEKHVTVDGTPVSGSIFDFALYFFHNAKNLLTNGSGPYFYLPKLESSEEARLWNDVFSAAESDLGLANGTIKATVLIETILASFEMDEILYELREHSAGLNCGRWDYIFSYIKKLRNQPDTILPDRSQVTMTVPFMRSYSRLAIQTCHKRGVHCIGGMAAQIPVKNNPQLNEEAFAKVRADKEREARDGHDGTWVAHPGLVPVAREVFDHWMKTPNQIHVNRDVVQIAAEDLIAVPNGTITESGLRTNISVGIQYIESWLRGYGAVPIFNLMEDAATAEISRAQVWQWIRHPKGLLDDGRKVTKALFSGLLAEELQKIQFEVGDDAFESGKFTEASSLFSDLTLADEFIDFLTIPGYEKLA
jgi:malate synthase